MINSSVDFPKITLFYGHVASNIGDIAINLGTINLIKRVAPTAEITAVLFSSENSPHLENSKQSFGNEAKIRFLRFAPSEHDPKAYLENPGLILKEFGLEDQDIIFIASGEYFFDYQDKNNDLNMYWRMLPVSAALQHKKKSIFLPSTFGPFETEEAKLLIKEVIKSNAFVSTRDAASTKVLNDIVKEDFSNNELLDPAFFIEATVKKESTAIKENGIQNVGLVMRAEEWGIRVPEEKRKKALERSERNQFDSTLEHMFAVSLGNGVLENAGRCFTVFAQTDADMLLSQAICEQLEKKFPNRVKLVKPQSINSYLEEIDKVDCIVASRFHALILGLVSEKPVFGVYFESHGHKIPGLFKLLEREQDCLCINSIAPQQAADLVLSSFAEMPSQTEIRNRITFLKKKTEHFFLKALKDDEQLSVSHNVEFLGVRFFGTRLALARDAALERKMRTRANQFKAEVTRLERELREEKDKYVNLEEEYLDISNKFKKELRRSKGLERDMLVLKNTSSYKLGSILVRAAKYPKASLKELPISLYKIWKCRGDRLALSDEHADLGLLDVYRKEGIKGVKKRVHQGTLQDPKNTAWAFIDASKTFKECGYPEVELQLVKTAVELDPSERILRALYWAATRSFDFQLAHDTAKRLLAPSNKSLDKSQLDFLEKYKRSPVSQLAILDHIPDVSEVKSEKIHNRICYILHNSLPYSSGGYATRAHGLAKGLLNSGIEVICISRPGFPLDIKHELSSDDVAMEDLIDGVRYVRKLTPLRSGISAADYMLAAADSLTEELKKYSPAHVVAASNHLTSLPALIAAKRLGIPFSYEVRGFWEITRVSREPDFIDSPAFKAQEILETEVAKQSSHVFTLTEPMKEELVRRGVNHENITLLPNSCEPEKFIPRARDKELSKQLAIPDHVPVIGYVGTFVQYEGLEDLAAAAANIKAKGIEFRLLLVGNENASGLDVGPITKEIDEIAKATGLDEWLIMPGRVPHEQVNKYYSLIDICPFPRKAQPVTELVSPMKPLEAFAMQKAVVVSSVRALSEMVEEEKTGLIYEKGNISSLEEVLIRLIKDKKLRTELGRMARQWVMAERTWNKTTSRLLGEIKLTRIAAEV